MRESSRNHESGLVQLIIRLETYRFRLVLPLRSSKQDYDDGDQGETSDTELPVEGFSDAKPYSAAEWVLAQGEGGVSAEDVSRHGHMGGESVSTDAHGTRKEITAILEGINRTDIA